MYGICKGCFLHSPQHFRAILNSREGAGYILREGKSEGCGGGISHTRHCHRTGSCQFVDCPLCLHCDDLSGICLNLCLRNQGLGRKGELLKIRLNRGIGKTVKANPFWFSVFVEFFFPNTCYCLLLYKNCVCVYVEL